MKFDLSGSFSQHRWIVTGLGMANDKYSVVASFSFEPTDEVDAFRRNAAGGACYGVQVYQRSSDGFKIAPYALDNGGGGRLYMHHNGLAGNLKMSQYRISFAVFASTTGAPF